MWQSVWRYLVNVFTGGRGWRIIEAEARQLIARARTLGPRYTMLKPYDETPEYVSIMAGIGASQELRWMLLQIRERAVANLVDKPMDGVAVNVGVIMTIEEIGRRFNEYIRLDKENGVSAA